MIVCLHIYRHPESNYRSKNWDADPLHVFVASRIVTAFNVRRPRCQQINKRLGSELKCKTVPFGFRSTLNTLDTTSRRLTEGERQTKRRRREGIRGKTRTPEKRGGGKKLTGEGNNWRKRERRRRREQRHPNFFIVSFGWFVFLLLCWFVFLFPDPSSLSLSLSL